MIYAHGAMTHLKRGNVIFTKVNQKWLVPQKNKAYIDTNLEEILPGFNR